MIFVDVKKTITQAEAARRLGVTTPTIAVLIKRGTLKHVTTDDGLKLLPIAEVERYKAERRQ